jgi:hypothetical protein
MEQSERAEHSDQQDGSEVDAEGSDDEGFGRSIPLTRDGSSHRHSDNAPTPGSSGSESVNQNGKRKSEVNEHDYINEHADLFNLRRSVSGSATGCLC